jgi:hypothetical protein
MVRGSDASLAQSSSYPILKQVPYRKSPRGSEIPRTDVSEVDGGVESVSRKNTPQRIQIANVRLHKVG